MALACIEEVFMALEKELKAYEGMLEELESNHMGKWVLIKESELIGIFSNFEEAANDAVARFGRGPYLIRRVGAPPMTLPASVMYHPVHV